MSRHFCRDCGSGLYASSGEEAAPGVMAVRMGTLDVGAEVGLGEEAMRPRVEYFCRERRKWLDGREEGGVDRKPTM